MRCPRCRSEVGSQKLCPYCGSQMYLPEWKPNPSSDSSGWSRIAKIIKNMETRMAETERKLRIMLVLESGIFVLLLLIFCAIMVK